MLCQRYHFCKTLKTRINAFFAKPNRANPKPDHSYLSLSPYPRLRRRRREGGSWRSSPRRTMCSRSHCGIPLRRRLFYLYPAAAAVQDVLRSCRHRRPPWGRQRSQRRSETERDTHTFGSRCGKCVKEAHLGLGEHTGWSNRISLLKL